MATFVTFRTLDFDNIDQCDYVVNIDHITTIQYVKDYDEYNIGVLDIEDVIEVSSKEYKTNIEPYLNIANKQNNANTI